MKVYLVEGFTAEPYESYTFIHSAYDSKEKADTLIKNLGEGVQDETLESCGWFVRKNCVEVEVL